MVVGAVLNRPLIHRKAVLFVVVLVTVCRSLLCVSSRYGYSPLFLSGAILSNNLLAVLWGERMP